MAFFVQRDGHDSPFPRAYRGRRNRDFRHQRGKKNKQLLDFISTVCADKSKRVLQAGTKLKILSGQSNGCSEDIITMVLLILIYFDEKEEILFHYVDDT